MSTLMPPPKKKSSGLLAALKHIVGIDRASGLRELARACVENEAAEAERAREREEAERAVEAWRAPETRLHQLSIAHRHAAAAGYRAAELLAAELCANPPACVTALRHYVDQMYSDVNRRPTPPGGLRGIGLALVAATVFCRDEGWRLPDAEAQHRCREVRDAIEAAVIAAGTPPEDAE
jgi:hypothetical protein